MINAASNDGEPKHLSTSIRNKTPPFHLNKKWNTLYLIEVACRARRMLSNETRLSTKYIKKEEKKNW